MFTYLKKITTSARKGLCIPTGGRSQDGVSVILAVALLLVIVTGFWFAENHRTANYLALTNHSLAKRTLKNADLSAIRQFDQYLKAGFLDVNCQGIALSPKSTAPALIKQQYKGGGKFSWTECNPKLIDKNAADSLFSVNGTNSKFQSTCRPLTAELQVGAADFSGQRVTLTAKSTSQFTRNSKDTQTEEVKAQLRLPRPPLNFAMVLNELPCAVCHVKITGDVISTEDLHVPASAPMAESLIVGRLLGAKGVTVDSGPGLFPRLKPTGGFKSNYRGTEMPRDINGDGVPDFPVIDWKNISKKVTGSVTTGILRTDLYGSMPKTVVNNQGPNRNAIFIGTNANPIQLDGEIYVDGDVIIKGVYTGSGTIYAKGNIYIPFDLVAKNSAFPYPADPVAAAKLGQDNAYSKDALGLAAAKSIFIGDIGSGTFIPGAAIAPACMANTANPIAFRQAQCHADKRRLVIDNFDICTPGQPCGKCYDVNPDHCQTIYDHPGNEPDFTAGRLTSFTRSKLHPEVVFAWLKTGMLGYESLYEKSIDCETSAASHLGSFNVVEANLYAATAVGGTARKNTYAINGSIISPLFHIVSGAPNSACTNRQDARKQKGLPIETHPVNGYPMDFSTINYDWRLKFGLPVLVQMASSFQGGLCGN